MKMIDGRARIINILHTWYAQNKRELPWRDTQDAYKIWISEVILQQTRVVQGHDYYVRFLQRFPTIQDLASAPEEDVLKLWQGLGYYSRARNLHAAAKMVMTNFGGVFPNTHKEILTLKGVGDYTAAAIASFAYDLPYATVDGNVYRVLSRLYGVATPIDSTAGKKEFAKLGQHLLDTANPALHNQAMMEMGALQCVPKSPRCDECPLSVCCVAYAEHDVESYPVKQGKVKVRDRFFSYLDIRCKEELLVNCRPSGDIWQGLYEFPLLETDTRVELEELLNTEKFEALFKDVNVQLIQEKAHFKHVLSHQIIYARFYRIEVDSLSLFPYKVIAECDMDDYPIPRLVEQYLEQD